MLVCTLLSEREGIHVHLYYTKASASKRYLPSALSDYSSTLNFCNIIILYAISSNCDTDKPLKHTLPNPFQMTSKEPPAV